MEILIAGLWLWSGVHLTPALAPSMKQRWIAKLGENAYKGVFSALIILSIVLIVMGWRSIEPSYFYTLPPLSRLLAILLMLVVFIFLGAAKRPTRIKHFIRNPQLSAIILWSIAHLLVNGDSRSLVLFSWLGVWAALDIVLINRRDGEWQKEPVPSWAKEIIGLVISVLVFVLVALLHPYIAGVSLRP